MGLEQKGIRNCQRVNGCYAKSSLHLASGLKFSLPTSLPRDSQSGRSINGMSYQSLIARFVVVAADCSSYLCDYGDCSLRGEVLKRGK